MAHSIIWFLLGVVFQQSDASLIEEAEKLPNIVFFMVDDMGWQDTSVVFHEEETLWNHLYQTPNMQRLAATGIRFTQAYAYSLCSPTRTSIMSGQNAARHRVTQWTLRPGKDPSQKANGMQSPDWEITGLQPGQPTLASLLREQGYRTIHVGKAHWGAYGTAGADPTNLGFDVNIAGHCAGGPGSFHGYRNFSAEWRKGDRIWDVPGLQKYHGKNIHLTEALTLEANFALEQAVQDNKPFFLYMSHYAIHAPLEKHEPLQTKYLQAGIPKPEATYASMVEGMDASLGQILYKLDELGVAEDTLIWFYSDNGGLSHGPRGKTPQGTGHYTHNWPLRSGKSSAYEGGIRVPMLVSWARISRKPERTLQARIPIAQGAKSEALVHCDDVLPTLCAWAGINNLSERLPYPDGMDITNYITGHAENDPERDLIFHYPHFINYYEQTIRHGYGPYSAMRSGKWKIIYFYDRQIWELYDLSVDISESQNLEKAHPEILRRLANRLKGQLINMKAQHPVYSDSGIPVPMRLPE